MQKTMWNEANLLPLLVLTAPTVYSLLFSSGVLYMVSRDNS